MRKSLRIVPVLLLFAAIGARNANADSYTQVNLDSDISGMAAHTDPNLKNPWGMSFSAASPFWVSDQAAGVATLYNGAGVAIPLVVKIPATGTGPQGPTGQVFNSAGAGNFILPDGTPATFMFATLAGTIDGWNGGAGTTAIQSASRAGAVYTGLALANAGGANFLYAANFTAGGGIDVFNSSFVRTTLGGNFVDPNLPAGYAPYNIQLVGSDLYVEYAKPGAMGAITGAGLVDVFDTGGNFIERFATGGQLDDPWGVTLAPSIGFGDFSGDLLVGNFGNGEINAFDPTNGTFLGTLDGSNGLPLVNSGLWSIDFGNAGSGNPDALYFTAGINGEADGLFGDIQATPEPGTLLLMLTGVGLLGLLVAIRKRVALRHPQST